MSAHKKDDTVGDSTLPAFSPPGNLPDFSASTKALWSSQYINYWMQGEITANPQVVEPGRTPLQQFFDGTVTPFDNTKQQAATWNAFPKLVTTAYKTTPLRWQVADASRMFQDEYLEWSVARDGSGNIFSASFTCEGPEYWQVYAAYQKSDFIATMRAMNSDFSSEMSDSDFFLVDPNTGAEVYNPNNYWNELTTTGTIAHLVQPNNTLSAEIDIAAQATVIRKDSTGKIITDGNQLINCSQYGNPGRNSDPTIGATINSFARQGVSLSVADPVALYIHNLDTSNFMIDMVSTTGTNVPRENLQAIKNPAEIFQFQRQGVTSGGQPVPTQGLRLRVKIPDGMVGNSGQQLNVSNIYDTQTKQHIRYGAQIADYVTMAVSAVAIPGTAAPAQPCFGVSQAAAAAEQPQAKVMENGTKAAVKKEHQEPKISMGPKNVNRKSHQWAM